MRLLLGDKAVHGVVAYANADLDGAVKALFRLGEGPVGYAVVGESIVPDLPDGDGYALIAYRAAQMLVQPEDGATSYRTRALSVTDAGHRKRDLLAAFAQRIYEIESGDGMVFETYQVLCVALQNLNHGGFIEAEVSSAVSKVTL